MIKRSVKKYTPSQKEKYMSAKHKKYNIEKKYRYSDYDEILRCDEINAIYISTLNNTHSEIIIKAAVAKKNILCEKPIATNYQDTIKIFDSSYSHDEPKTTLGLKDAKAIVRAFEPLRVFTADYSSGGLGGYWSKEEISYNIVAKNKDHAMELALQQKKGSVKSEWKIEEIDMSCAAAHWVSAVID